jgi:uncharacterized protein YkwD
MSRHRQQKTRSIWIAGITAACVAGAAGAAVTSEHWTGSSSPENIALASSWTAPEAAASTSPTTPGTQRKHRKHRHHGHRHGHHRPTASPTTPTTPPTTPPTASPTKPPTASPTTPPATPTVRPTTPAPAPTTTTAPPTGGSQTQQYQAEVIRLVNVERSKAGCQALTANSALTKAAQAHAQDMLSHNYFSHNSQDGTSPFTRMTAAGYRWSSAAENIAAGQHTPADVMTSWMNSSGHRANILNCGLKNIGVGYAAGSGATYGQYWVQDFGTPA